MKTPFQRISVILATLGVLVHLPLPSPAASTNLVSVADTTLFEHDPTNNLGGKPYAIAGTIGPFGQGQRSRALFKFNVLAALPTNAAVASVSLALSVPIARGAGQVFHLHRMLRDWGEGVGTGGGFGAGQGSPANPGEATWLAAFHPATLWTSPGADSSDYVATASASQTMGATSLNFSSPGMAADVRSWLSSPASNFGWIIIADNESTLSTASHISTREAPSDKPVLSIVYEPPAPPPPPNLFDVAQVGSVFRFSFDGQSGRSYTIESRSPLNSGWSTTTNIPTLAAPTTVHFTNSISGNEKYYRARTP